MDDEYARIDALALLLQQLGMNSFVNALSGQDNAFSIMKAPLPAVYGK